MKKTNAARILDNLKIKYELHDYKVDENDLSAENVAGKIGLPPGQVFKTLVARGDKNGVLMACIPAGHELDLKALAVVSGNKKVEMAALKEVQPLTGYIRGGVSPLGSKKHYPVFINESALAYSCIAISAGMRGCQIFINPEDLIKAVEAKTYKLTVDK
ncbi:MAG: Cys-tRNA(Pro) deacylase [Pelosinus sp.]|nr:Cys-tRNA(Pro) deacylase [Pelosinus sp.]